MIYRSSSTHTILPAISIVIPVYNAEQWIGESLKTVLQQSYASDQIEIIIVDDGSSDSSIDRAIATLTDTQAHVVMLSITNGGPSRARNIGWQIGKGAWVQFLDADDLLHPHKIALQMRAAALASPEVAVIYSDWQRYTFCDGSWGLNGTVAQPRLDIDPLDILLRADGFIQLGAAIFRRSWLEQLGGFDERYWLIEDVDLLLRIAIAGGQFHHVVSDEPLFLYRQHAASLSRRDKRAFIEGCIRNAQMVEAYWRDRNQLTFERAELLATIYLQGTRYFAGVDWRTFECLMQQIEHLVPGFLPQRPLSLRRLSQLIGYRQAERVAVLYRSIKQYAGRA